MNKVIHKLILDMKSVIVQQTIDIQRYDTGRKFEITLSDNGAVYQIGDGCIAVFTATKPDGTVLYNHCDVVDNTIVFDLLKNPQVAAAEGEVRCEIRLYGADGSLITSPCFDIVVDKTVYTDNIIESSSEFTALTQAIVANINATKAANDAVEKAQLDIAEAVSNAESTVANAVSNANDAVSKAISDAEAEVDEAVADMRTIVDDSANAIKGNVSGPVVSMADVSSFEHEVKVKVGGKNLFDASVFEEEQTVNGVTIKRSGNTFVFNGTATEGFSYEKYGHWNLPQPAVLSLAYFSGSVSNIVWFSMKDGGDKQIQSRINADCSTSYYSASLSIATRAWFWIEGGTTFENLTLAVQLEAGETATAYEPWLDPATITLSVKDASGETVATYTPNSDGTVEGIKSISPTMTLSTDTANAIIECEYNRDSNKVLEELLMLMSQGGLSTSAARIVDVSIYANKWVGTKSPYSQVVAVEGATEYSQVDLTPSVEQLSVFHNKDLAFVTENVDGVVTVYAIGQKPENDYTIQATVKEVKI